MLRESLPGTWRAATDEEAEALDLTGALLCLVAWSTTVLAEPIKVTVGTTTLSGMSATLAFDVIDGGSPSSTVVLSSFTTDGTLGGSSTSGGASSPPPVTAPARRGPTSDCLRRRSCPTSTAPRGGPTG